MSKSIHISLYLHGVDVAEVETLICYPSDLSCQFIVLEQSAAMSDAHLPCEVQRFIYVHLSLNSANSYSVKELVEPL